MSAAAMLRRPAAHPANIPASQQAFRPVLCSLPCSGFTLVEVLVALVIAAVALAAAVRALSFSTDHVQALRERQLAMMSAENHLAELHLGHIWPNPGSQFAPCPQGALALVCTQRVQATQNAAFRQVTVSVALDGGPVLARLTGILSRRP